MSSLNTRKKIKNLDPDQPIDPLDVVSYMKSWQLTGLEAAYRLGMTPTEHGNLAKAEPGEPIGDISRAIITRLYSEHQYLLKDDEPPHFAELVDLLQSYYPDITSKEVAQLLGATHQNGSRWMSGFDFRKPKIKRIAKAIQLICAREGKRGAKAAIEEIRKEYKLQGRDHTIRSPLQMENDETKQTLMALMQGHFSSITEKELAILCGATKRTGDYWYGDLNISSRKVKPRVREMIALASEECALGINTYVQERLNELEGTDLEQHVRTLPRLQGIEEGN